MLTAAQRAALAHVRDRALSRRPAALAVIARVLAGSGIGHRPEEMIAAIGRHGRLTVNFHPDRLCADGRPVAEALLDEGVYRSQFVTGISNGGLTAYPGGDRDRWEEAMFGGAYQTPGVRPGDRPVYGGLNLLDHPDGACPRFGSCHLVLRPEVSARTTFTFGDSHLLPRDHGTVDVFEPVLAALLTAAADTGVALGVPADLVTLVRTVLRRREDAVETRARRAAGTTARAVAGTGGSTRPARAGRPAGRALDDYVEAQVHGTVHLARDVEALVVDPSFDGTAVGATLDRLSHRHRVPLRRHAGFVLPVDGIDPDFRGPAIPPLAARVHAEFANPGDPVDAALVGRAAVSVVTEPDRWADRGPTEVTLQHLKQLWHVLVRYGTPHDR
ncbi:DUF3626 domain-containing protein [Micromonospora endolithica]|uniref:DUF3626 domain-containing protein n=1 Tax=Micromonospora endolithica TaxID=230091 RepID=UPI0011AC71F3|nr:DUF3626 domain-containing protein [Micromonospora endolithica]TWJ22145.1 uncharacterized protein DUF3626 [Micromonospora endolithica]